MMATQIMRLDICGHVFHALCLTTWVATQIEGEGGPVNLDTVTCPMCQTRLLRPQEKVLAEQAITEQERQVAIAQLAERMAEVQADIARLEERLALSQEL